MRTSHAKEWSIIEAREGLLRPWDRNCLYVRWRRKVFLRSPTLLAECFLRQSMSWRTGKVLFTASGPVLESSSISEGVAPCAACPPAFNSLVVKCSPPSSAPSLAVLMPLVPLSSCRSVLGWYGTRKLAVWRCVVVSFVREITDAYNSQYESLLLHSWVSLLSCARCAWKDV